MYAGNSFNTELTSDHTTLKLYEFSLWEENNLPTK